MTTATEEKPARRVYLDVPPDVADTLEQEANKNMRTFRAECTMILVKHAENLPAPSTDGKEVA